MTDDGAAKNRQTARSAMPPRPPGSRRPRLDDPVGSPTLPASLICPFCGSGDTAPFAAFGGQASTAQYYCNGCRTVFEALRWR